MPCLEIGRINFEMGSKRNLNKIAVCSLQSVGGTFVDWSIQFLSGQQTHYHHDSGSWLELVRNPITNTTAHLYKKNHPAGAWATLELLNSIDQFDQGVFTFYPQALRYVDVLQTIAPGNTAHNIEVHQTIINALADDFNDILTLSNLQHTKLIYVDSSPEIALYHTVSRRAGSFITQSGIGNQHELNNEFYNFYYRKETTPFDDNVWSVREARALDFRLPTAQCSFNFDLPHLWIDCRSFWTLGLEVMDQIMQFVGLSIQSERIDEWLLVWCQWAKIQFKSWNFSHNIPHILESIIHGWDYEIGTLTFEEEVVIQHLLIYQHNSNLKTYGLVKFPTNTKDLHLLLESNIHPVESIY